MKKKVLLYLTVIYGILLALCTTSCTFNLFPPDITFSDPVWSMSPPGYRFTLSNEGTRTIQSFVVRGRLWKDGNPLELHAVCTTSLDAGMQAVFHLPFAVSDAEIDMIFIETVAYSDGYVWRDPLGVFAKYYIRQ